MADAPIGRPELAVRSAGVVERLGSATDRQPRRQSRQERRDKEPPNPRRRRVYDMLFDEIDQIDALDEHQRTRIKDNIRRQLTPERPHAAPRPHVHPYAQGYASEPASTGPPESDEDHEQSQLAERMLADPEAPPPLDHDRIVAVAAPLLPELAPAEVEENIRLGKQLRDCLAQHTERARKVAVYLHLLFHLNGHARPRLVVDI